MNLESSNLKNYNTDISLGYQWVVTTYGLNCGLSPMCISFLSLNSHKLTMGNNCTDLNNLPKNL